MIKSSWPIFQCRYSGGGGGLRGLGSDLGMKILSVEAVLADCGQPQIVQCLGQIAQDAPSWSQDGAKMRQVGALDRHPRATCGAILAMLKGFGGNLYKNGRIVKRNNSIVLYILGS